MTRAFELAVSDLRVKMTLVPWDTAAFGFNVAQVDDLNVGDPLVARMQYAAAQEWLDSQEVTVASCRLRNELLRESMLLEGVGYRFIEMVLHPRMDRLDARRFPEGDLDVRRATPDDLDELVTIGASAFGTERFHVDPRLDRRCADRRYANWVANAFGGGRQELLALRSGAQMVALFIVEDTQDGGAYWHLTAVAPAQQGKGYGRRAWATMLEWHRDRGRTYVSTTISARNVRTLNLYSSMRFKFMPPEMTFHWVREAT